MSDSLLFSTFVWVRYVVVNWCQFIFSRADFSYYFPSKHEFMQLISCRVEILSIALFGRRRVPLCCLCCQIWWKLSTSVYKQGTLVHLIVVPFCGVWDRYSTLNCSVCGSNSQLHISITDSKVLKREEVVRWWILNHFWFCCDGLQNRFWGFW